MKRIHQMPFDDALLEIIRYARRERTSPANDRAVIRALLSLRLRDMQLLRVGAYMELWKDDGSAWDERRMSFNDANGIVLLPARVEKP